MFLFRRLVNVMHMSLVTILCIIVVGTGNTVAIAASSNTQQIKNAVLAFKTIATLRKEFPINANAIFDSYTGELQSLTQEIDAIANLSLDGNVLAAIDEIKNNNEPLLAAQVIDKSLQHVFFQTILDRITQVRDDFDNSASINLLQRWDEATAAFEAIKGTVARENKVISADRKFIETGTNPALDVQVTESLARGRAALSKVNPDEDKILLSIERQIIRISLARAYYIGVLREVSGVLSSLDDEDSAREAQKEGEIFYRIIETFVSRDNPLGNKLIKKQLTGNIADIVADEIVSEMNKGFIGRVKDELEANESSIGNDRGRAMEVAEEAMLYANVFLPDLGIRLGTKIQVSMESALSSLKNASNVGNTTNAALARDTISTILLDYEKELTLTQYDKTQDTSLIVDGAVKAFQAISTLRKQFPIDSDSIAIEYAGDLQQLVQYIDQIYSLSINRDILAAIESIKNEDQVFLAAQVIDKSLQRIFALTVYNRITLVNDYFSELTVDELMLEWDRAYAAYLAFIGTAARENKILTADKQMLQSGNNPDIDDQVTLAFVHGRQALNKNGEDDQFQVTMARERIIIPLVRSFLIGVLREVEGIIKDRGTEVEEAREKQIEGEYFYRIVEGFISQDNPSGNSRIKTQLTGDLTNVDANAIVSEISRGIIGQISRDLSLVEVSFAVNKSQSLLAAERMSLYADIILSDLELRLGSSQRIKIENALQDLMESTETGSLSKAVTARTTILQIISDYEKELI